MTNPVGYKSILGHRLGLTPYGLLIDGVPMFKGAGLYGGDAKTLFVDPANGDDGSDGESPDRALATVSAAYALTVDKRGDVIVLLNDGNTSGTSREDSTITWSNDNTHLIGMCAPTMISQRARISPPAGQSTIVTPQLLVSGHGNIFANISLFEGTSEDTVASTCVSVTGNRNYFHNVAMMNMGDATNGHSGDEAGSEHLLLDGAEENTFERCYIGLDTANRSAANANVRCDNAAARNIFRGCVFPAMADASSPLFVDIPGASDIDRFILFDDCLFHNAIGSTATTMDAAMVVHASAGGLVLLKGCMQVGATEWLGATNANVYIDMPTPDGVGPAGGTAVSFST